MEEIAARDGRIGGRKLLLLVVLPAALAAAGVVLLPPGLLRLAAMAVLAIPALVLALDRPELAFYLLVIVLFSNLDLFLSFRLYRAVLALAILGLCLAVANGRRIVGHHSLLLALAAAFTICAVQSLVVARDYDPAIAQLVEFLKTLFAVAIAFQFARDRAEFRRFVLVLAVAILLNDFVPLVVKPPSMIGALSMVWEQGVFRYEGFTYEPNQFALLQLFLVPLLVYLAVAYRRRPLVSAFFSVSVAACVVVLALSFSRGGFVGLGVLAAALFFLERRNKRVLFAGLALLVAAAAIAPAVYWDRIESMLSFVRGERFDFSIYTRVETMKEALRLGVRHPLFGVGIDNFIYALGSAMPYRMIVHNTFLQVFADLGAVALAAFAGVIVCNFLVIGRLMRRADPEGARLGRLLCVQHLAVLTGALFIPVAYDPFFWFLLALPAIADYCWRDAPLTVPGRRAAGSTSAA